MNALCLFTSACLLAAAPNESPRPPNVVLLLADDLGYGALDCYGQTQIKTPHLDRMAAQGMRFTQMYAGCHVCQPSRSVLMTGLHTGHSACRANDANQLLLKEDVTLAEVLKDAGYATGLFGKWGLGFEGTSGHPQQQGFDRFFGQCLQVHCHFQYAAWCWDDDRRFEFTANHGKQQGRYVQDEVQARALEWMRSQSDRPFFAYLAYIIPHVELVVPEDSEVPYRGQFPKRAILDPRKGYLGSEDGFTTFAGMVSRLDRYVGEVFALLEEKGIADNTLVIFTSDNGGQNGGKDGGWTAMTDFFHANAGFRGYKGGWYEGGIRVPFIAQWPGRIPAGRTSDYVGGFQDVLPTVAELTRAKPPEKLDGLSFAPTLLGQGTQSAHDVLYWEYPVARSTAVSRAARVGRWKAIQTRPDGPVELYDLDTDPGERTNRAAEFPVVVQTLTAKMDREHTPVRDYPVLQPRQTIDDFVH
jgi:arylsulfatase A